MKDDPHFVEALLRLAAEPERDEIVTALSMRLLRMRMRETFGVLVGDESLDYLLLFVDDDGHAAVQSNMDRGDAARLFMKWLDASSERDNDEDES